MQIDESNLANTRIGKESLRTHQPQENNDSMIQTYQNLGGVRVVIRPLKGEVTDGVQDVGKGVLRVDAIAAPHLTQRERVEFEIRDDPKIVSSSSKGPK